ncbi:MAG: SDR family oxidoreductase [Bacteroidales bacterium]|nr:SDR family oxidoreductase [Bacteroidales bacterium]
MNCIITGASSGIGFYTALELANSNSGNLVFALGRSQEGLIELENQAKYKNIKTFSFDLGQSDFSPIITQISDFFKVNSIGVVDVLINNAGYLVNKSFTELTSADWQKTFEINLLAPVKLIQALFSYFNKEEGSHIVNIASMGGVQGSRKFAGLSAYSASKAAIANLTESLAVEFKPHNIHVNAICPGAVGTKMLKSAFPGFIAPVGPESMGKYIADFALNHRKLMNGRIIQVSLEG